MSFVSQEESMRRICSLIESAGIELELSLSRKDVESIVDRHVKMGQTYDKKFFLDILREDLLERF